MHNRSHNLVHHTELYCSLEKEVHGHARNASSLGILALRIKEFDTLKTRFGYSTSSALISHVANRLVNNVREKDHVLRTGEYSFILLLPELKNKGHAKLAAYKAINILKNPFIISGLTFLVHTALGVAIYPDHGESAQELVRNAEIAATLAEKQQQPFLLFTSQYKNRFLGELDLKESLSVALERDELELYYQPKISFKTGLVHSAEALIRWNHRKAGIIPPDIFIPIAEKNNYIQKINWWALNTALRHLVGWPTHNMPLTIAVNISAYDLNNDQFVQSVRNAINLWGIQSDRLTLEITERTLLNNTLKVKKTLAELRECGVRISIDDFGTGYSSLAYFKNLPANELKIDKSFVTNILKNSCDEHIIRAIVALAKGFKLEVVAEGIENWETYKRIRTLGCDYAQGFLISKPLPQDKFIRWLNEHAKHQHLGMQTK